MMIFLSLRVTADAVGGLKGPAQMHRSLRGLGGGSHQQASAGIYLVLLSLNVSNFTTTKVTNMIEMFNGCENLVSLDLNSFDTINVTTMEMLFQKCINLENLNIDNFNKANVLICIECLLNVIVL